MNDELLAELKDLQVRIRNVGVTTNGTLAGLANDLQELIDSNSQPKRRRIGMNINGITDIDPCPVYADAVRNTLMLERWGDRKKTPPSDTPHPLPLASGMRGRVPLWSREGDEFTLVLQNAIVELAGKTFQSSDPMMPVVISPGNNSHETLVINSFSLSSSTCELYYPGQYAHGIESGMFHSDFLESLKQFDILRMLNWTATNNSPRIIPMTFSQQSSPVWGVSERESFRLCKIAGKHIWLCIPHLATEEYIQNVAQDARKFRDENGYDIYLEFSNECWNSQFDQTQWCHERWIELHPKDGRNQMGIATVYGQYAARLFRMFDRFYGEDYVRVLSGQAAGGIQKAEWAMTEFVEEYGRTPDCWAIAPYLHRSDAFPFGSTDDLVSQAIARSLLYGVPKIVDQIKRHKDFADQNGCELVGYEAGEHINPVVGIDGSIFHAAKKHPLVADAYAKFYEEWDRLGCGDLCFLAHVQAPRRDGRWFGHMENLGDTDNPKWKSLMRIVDHARNAG